MFIIDSENEKEINVLSLYFTFKEAKEMLKELQSLVEDPEAYEHFHLVDDRKELACSIITENKLKNMDKYNEVERRILSE